MSAYDSLFANQDAFGISLSNLYIAGWPIIKNIIDNWSKVWAAGIKPNPGQMTDVLKTIHA